MKADFQDCGWQTFAPEPELLEWVRHARPAALGALADPAHAPQHQCQGTWFVGLDALPNDAQGRIGDGPTLSGAALAFATRQAGGRLPLHAGQVSVIRAGYPRPRDSETDAAFGYRLRRDAAHVDGVLGLGTPKRRFLREPHGFVLGIPLGDASSDAAPLVVWEGSHEVMRDAFRGVLQGHDPANWHTVDITETYISARKQCFDTCARVAVHAPPGGAYVVHRLALHGVAPWGADAHAGPEGRMIAYFRPDLAGGLVDWLNLP